MPSAKSRSVKARSSSWALIPSRARGMARSSGRIAASSLTRFQTCPAREGGRVGVVELCVAFAGTAVGRVGTSQHCAIGRRAPRLRRLTSAAFFSSLSWNSTSSRRAARSRSSMRSRSICSRTACTTGKCPSHLIPQRDRAWPMSSSTQQVLRGVEELLMFVLAVQFDEAVREVLEGRGRGERAVDERAAAALRRDLAPHDQIRCRLRSRRCASTVARSSPVRMRSGWRGRRAAARRLRRGWTCRRRFRRSGC